MLSRTYSLLCLGELKERQADGLSSTGGVGRRQEARLREDAGSCRPSPASSVVYCVGQRKSSPLWQNSYILKDIFARNLPLEESLLAKLSHELCKFQQLGTYTLKHQERNGAMANRSTQRCQARSKSQHFPNRRQKVR